MIAPTPMWLTIAKIIGFVLIVIVSYLLVPPLIHGIVGGAFCLVWFVGDWRNDGWRFAVKDLPMSALSGVVWMAILIVMTGQWLWKDWLAWRARHRTYRGQRHRRRSNG